MIALQLVGFALAVNNNDMIQQFPIAQSGEFGIESSIALVLLSSWNLGDSAFYCIFLLDHIEICSLPITNMGCFYLFSFHLIVAFSHFTELSLLRFQFSFSLVNNCTFLSRSNAKVSAGADEREGSHIGSC